MNLETEARVHLERKITHLDATVKAQSEAYASLMDVHQQRMEEKIEHLDKKLDRVIDRMERPVNWPAWIGSTATVLGALGLLLYVAYVKPLEDRVDLLEQKYKALQVQRKEPKN